MAQRTAVTKRRGTGVARRENVNALADTTVALGATFNVNGTDVTLNTGDINKLGKEGFRFELTEPVTLGTVNEFLNWLKTGPLKLPIPDINWDGLPSVFKKVPDLEVIITVFKLDTKAKTFAVGVTFSLPESYEILPGVAFKSFAVVVGNDIAPPVPPE